MESWSKEVVCMDWGWKGIGMGKWAIGMQILFFEEVNYFI
jgi:hypothetical protein